MALVYTRLFEELPPANLLHYEVDDIKTLFQKTLTRTDIESKLVIVGRNRLFFDQELEQKKPRVNGLSYPAGLVIVDQDGVIALGQVKVNRETSHGSPYIKWKDFCNENVGLEFESGQSIRVWYHWERRVLEQNERNEDIEDDENENDGVNQDEERVVNLLSIIMQRFQPPPPPVV